LVSKPSDWTSCRIPVAMAEVIDEFLKSPVAKKSGIFSRSDLVVRIVSNWFGHFHKDFKPFVSAELPTELTDRHPPVSPPPRMTDEVQESLRDFHFLFKLFETTRKLEGPIKYEGYTELARKLAANDHEAAKFLAVFEYVLKGQTTRFERVKELAKKRYEEIVNERGEVQQETSSL